MRILDCFASLAMTDCEVYRDCLIRDPACLDFNRRALRLTMPLPYYAAVVSYDCYDFFRFAYLHIDDFDVYYYYIVK